MGMKNGRVVKMSTLKTQYKINVSGKALETIQRIAKDTNATEGQVLILLLRRGLDSMCDPTIAKTIADTLDDLVRRVRGGETK
jgi:hypothetical protein